MNFGQTPTIALTTLSGEITDSTANEFFHVTRELLVKHPTISGFIVRISSSGGSLGAAEAIVETLNQVREETGATVATVVEEAALSAAFYVAVAGDLFAAQPSSLLGSVGTCMRRYHLGELAKRLGIRELSVASSHTKLNYSMPFQFDDAEDGNAPIIVQALDREFREYLHARHPQIERDSPLLDGRIFTGKAAHDAGLTAVLGGTVSAIRNIATTRDVPARLLVISSDSGFSKGSGVGGFLAPILMRAASKFLR